MAHSSHLCIEKQTSNGQKKLLSTNDNLHLTHHLRVFILICAKKKNKVKYLTNFQYYYKKNDTFN